MLHELNEGHLNNDIKKLQKEIDCLLKEEDAKWKQRTKEKWLKEGDKNIKFFHNCANQRRTTNMIHQITNVDGQVTKVLEEIDDMFWKVFQEFVRVFQAYKY